jgi:hypothetical protein
LTVSVDCAIGCLAIAVACLGAGCRDDGNDLVGADGTSQVPVGAGESDAARVSSQTAESNSAAQALDATSDATGSQAADDAGDDARSPTGSAPPADGAEPATNAVPVSGDGSGDAAPPSSDPSPADPPIDSPPPSSTQPIDAGTRAFCDAVVAADNMFTRGPSIDFATATPEQIAVAVDEHTAALDPLLSAALAAAPAGVAADVGVVVDLVRSSLASGADVTSNAEYRVADERVDVFVADSCGYPTVAVSAVEYSFVTLPTALAAGRTTFVFSNNGAEIHEMVVFRIDDDVTETVDALLALPEDEAFSRVVFAGATFGEQGVTDTETLELTRGRYVALCFVPVGTIEATTPEDELAEPGLPHFTAGMQAEFTVT